MSEREPGMQQERGAPEASRGFRVRTFYFTDPASRRVLYFKNSREIDYTIEGSGFDVHEVVTKESPAAPGLYAVTYHPAEGLRPASPSLSEQERVKFALETRKIEALVLLRTNLALMAREIDLYYAPGLPAVYGVQPEHYRRTLEFLFQEKELLLRHCQQFFTDFQRTVEACKDLVEVEAVFTRLVNNVRMGFFSPLRKRRERAAPAS